jgi:archaellum biogenesis ATPase FlaH
MRRDNDALHDDADTVDGGVDIDLIRVVSLEEFVTTPEDGAEPLVGEGEEALIPVGGNAMFYGDGGTGKTTLGNDLAFSLTTGEDWIGFPVSGPVNVLLIESEGPRPMFRRKLGRKHRAWSGPSPAGRLRVLEHPWTGFTFDEPKWRGRLAEIVERDKTDVIIAGPLSAIGMNSAGTIQEVRNFMGLVQQVRDSCGRPLTVILIHHDNKGGAVSGAWEGAGDTLLHVQRGGNGHTTVYVQKARWSSRYHGRTHKLKWTDGEGFEVEGERDLLDEVLGLMADGGWRTADETSTAVGARGGAVKLILNDADRFEMRTGVEAEKLGRSKRAYLYQIAS